MLPAPDRSTQPSPADRAEEVANSLTHGFGMVLSVAGLYALVQIAGRSNVPGQSVGCIIYGVALVLLYTASTLYHGCRDSELKRTLLVLDHIGIYVLIAGTYTPLALIPLRGSGGYLLLALIWGLALAGSLAKIGRSDRIAEDPPWTYLAMSWMVLVASGRIAANAPPGGVEWLVAGGIFYTAGLVFFVNRERRFHHAIWHLFVLAGSICHYRAVIGFALRG
jgi:hemolysin III